MIAIVQRVDRASVAVDGEIKGRADKGLLVLVGVGEGDNTSDAELLANKVANLRIFTDENDKMNLSALDVGGEILAISNFTLMADTKKGNRPSFIGAMEPVGANNLYEHFCETLKNIGVKSVDKGVFGADMHISAELCGPVTITLNTDTWRKK